LINIKNKEIFQILVWNFILTIILVFIFNIYSTEKLEKPLVYSNKYSQDVYDFYTGIKNYLDTKNIYINKTRGFPHEANYSALPQLENINLLEINLIGKLGFSLFATINIYILIGFYLSANCMGLLLYRSSDNRNLSLIAIFSILFSLAPYHFYRLLFGHVFLANYFIVPLVLLYPLVKFKKIYIVLIGILSSGLGAYYFIYSAIYILIITIYENNNFRNKVINLGLFGVASFIAVIPNLLIYFNALKDGSPEDYVTRSLKQAFVFGFRPQLLFSIPYYELGVGNFSQKIENLYGRSIYNENISSSLGLTIILLICILLIYSIKQTTQSRIEANKDDLKITFIFKYPLNKIKNSNKLKIYINENKRYLYLLIFSLVLYSNFFGSMILAALSNNLLRSNTRGSIFIECLVIVLLYKILIEFKRLRYIYLIILIAIIHSLIGLQRIKYYDNSIFLKDMELVQFLNKNEYENKILTLPYLIYPEKAINGISYHHLVSQFSQNSPHISYGGLKNTDADINYMKYKDIEDTTYIIKMSIIDNYTLILLDYRGFDSNTLYEAEQFSTYCKLVYFDKFRYIYDIKSCLK